jgi:hypothetical protein
MIAISPQLGKPLRSDVALPAGASMLCAPGAGGGLGELGCCGTTRGPTSALVVL